MILYIKMNVLYDTSIREDINVTIIPTHQSQLIHYDNTIESFSVHNHFYLKLHDKLGTLIEMESVNDCRGELILIV